MEQRWAVRRGEPVRGLSGALVFFRPAGRTGGSCPSSSARSAPLASWCGFALQSAAPAPHLQSAPQSRPPSRHPLWLSSPPQRFTEAVLGDDEKNYHAWCHRLAVVRLFGLWEQEMGFTARMLERDVHNNSAWNQVRGRAALSWWAVLATLLRCARRRAVCVLVLVSRHRARSLTCRCDHR